MRGKGEGSTEVPRNIAEGAPSFLDERQQILNDEVAGQVHDGTDKHQREGKPHP